jgi:elongation factor Ts
MEISTAQIKELREVTGAGVLECRKTLEETKGDMAKAVALLKEKGLAKAAKKAERATKDGLVEVYGHPGNRVGVLLEVNCESDFVARTEDFKALVHDLALHVAFSNPRYVRPEDIPADALEALRATFRAEAAATGKPANILDRIVQGKLDKYLDEVCLLRQPFVKDDKVKVGDLVTAGIAKIGENIVVRRFARYELGEA